MTKKKAKGQARCERGGDKEKTECEMGVESCDEKEQRNQDIVKRDLNRKRAGVYCKWKKEQKSKRNGEVCML